jgi:hypothetical protein
MGGSAAVRAGKLDSWIMRRSFRFPRMALNEITFQPTWRITPPTTALWISDRGLVSSGLLTVFCQRRGFALRCYILA